MAQRRVVIVGGGTAGWMTASYLKAAFADRIDITLVESGTVGTIGVGEATFSDIRHFFEFLGLKESDWMPACNATYKLAVRFQDWREPGHHFYHPFEQMQSVNGFPLTDWWLAGGGHSKRFDKDCFMMTSLCDAGRSPRYLDGTLFGDERHDADEAPGLTMSEHQGRTQFPYAYHFEAALLAKYLAVYATDRGVHHVVDDVTHVPLDRDGWVDGVVTAEHGTLTGDLYVDCTGFKGVLLNKALDEPFISFKDTLPNDSAVALQVPLDMKARGIDPYTRATAQDAGWIWTIPLYGRIGTGYVFARDYLDPDDAERTLREFVGPEAADVPANHIRMRIGRTRNSWVRNCVGVGLTSGFVEPLESTGIFFIHHACEQLVKHFPSEDWNPVHRDLYNDAVTNVMEGVREFLATHYRAAGRNDTQYWKDAKTRAVPDGLAERLERWQVELPDSEGIATTYHGLPPYSYMCILLGMGGLPLQPTPGVVLSDPSRARDEFRTVRATAAEKIRRLPNQHEFFTAMR